MMRLDVSGAPMNLHSGIYGGMIFEVCTFLQLLCITSPPCADDNVDDTVLSLYRSFSWRQWVSAASTGTNRDIQIV